MNWFSLLAAAAFLTLALTARADQFARSAVAQPGESDFPGEILPVGGSLDTDFPDYPPGFSSYRGLGFMGSCCQPCSPRAQRAWAGYCEGEDGCEPAPVVGFLPSLPCWLQRPQWCGAPCDCKTCDAPEAKAGPVAPSYHEPLWMKWQRWRAQWSGMFGGVRAGWHCDSCVEEGKTLEPAKDQTDESAEPAPEPPVPEPPAPHPAGENRPHRLSPPTTDRSA
ncbi:MAG: hypothetical protein GX575_16900 [Candidatus Anammoximicrobium sp.]|nr:hypothetical protein [Candidatus Anammoximicrobium sp.]